MINKELIDFISKKLNIARRDLIEKDVILTKILFYLTQNVEFFQNYVFKGGTCLTKCYFDYFRFSEDLDFTYLNQKDFIGKSKNKTRKMISEKINKLGELIDIIAKHLDLDFKKEKENKKYFQFGGSNAFVTFKIWYQSQELGKETFVKIQFNHIEKLYYPIKELDARYIVPKNLEKDFSFLAQEETELLLKPIKIKSYDLKEILIEKVRAILTRRGIKARDYVDIFLIIKREKLDIHNFKKQIKEKINYMLKFEKYQQNINDKEAQLDDEFILKEEEAIILTPIGEDFPKFLKKFNLFLKEIIREI